MVYLTSSRRVDRPRFDSLASALTFLESRTLSQEIVCIVDARGAMLHTQCYN